MTALPVQQARLDAAADAIRQAFADVPYPGDRNIARRSTSVPWERDLEPQQIEAFFAGRSWQQVTIELLRSEYCGDESACLVFMTPAAFHYYIPAYMLISLQGQEVADITLDTTLSVLTPEDRPPGPGTYEDDFDARVAPLTTPQRRAVAQFLLAMQDAYGAVMLPAYWPAVPLHLFWAKYLDEAERASLPPFPAEQVEQARRDVLAIMREHGVGGLP